MKPQTENTAFGSITIEGHQYPHDVLIRLDGAVKKRKKKLSKRIYGTSHVISLEEAEHIYQEGASTLLVGTGQYNQVRLSDEAREYLEERGVTVVLAPTPEAVEMWNRTGEEAIGLFHVTC